MSYYRHYINIGEYAKGQVIENFISINKKPHFNGSKTSLFIDNNAYLNYVKLSCENKVSYHLGFSNLNIKNNSIVENILITCNANKLNKNQINTQINGKKSNLLIKSLLLLSKSSINSLKTNTIHNNIDSLSKQIHKIIAYDKSTGIFEGLIKILKKSLNTSSKMINNNLLLNNSAKIITKPELEIYANDIKCNHGATISNIDENQLFFLCTRGIKNNFAKKILIYAFTTEITNTIKQKSTNNIIFNYINNLLQEKIYELSNFSN